jgi:hypothetical protein
MSNSWADTEPRDSFPEEKPLVNGPFNGADDGTRTRDPHLGNVARAGLLTCGDGPICPVRRAFSFPSNPRHVASFPGR